MEFVLLKFTEWFITKYKWRQLSVLDNKWEFVLLNFIECYITKYKWRQLTDVADWWKEGNVLFHDTLITFYLRLYGIRHMVKYHSDSERGNLLLPHGLLFPINSNSSFICTIPQTGLHIPRRLLHQSWVHHMMDRSDNQSHHEQKLLPTSCSPDRWRGQLVISCTKVYRMVYH